MSRKQKIVVFEQNGSGQSKIAGIHRFGQDRFVIETVSIDVPLPVMVEDGREYLPREIDADLVLDYLKHPDLCHDLALICREKGIPIVASRKKNPPGGGHHPTNLLRPVQNRGASANTAGSSVRRNLKSPWKMAGFSTSTSFAEPLAAPPGRRPKKSPV